MQDRARLTGLQSSPYKSALFYCYVSILVIQQAESWKDDHKFYELQIIISKFDVLITRVNGRTPLTIPNTKLPQM